jgi:hypothetical protein
MTSAAEVLTAGGILRAAEVVELAAATSLDLAAAATMLAKESGGGRNVWGSDGVVVAPGTYVKGAPVTQSTYLAYRAAVVAGRAGRQGCGPTQLTYGGYQDQADAAGGCWDWRANVATGFRALQALIKAKGLRDGFRAYNGTGPAAEAYASASITIYNSWRARLAGASSTPEDDMPSLDEVRAVVRSEVNAALAAALAEVVTRDDLGWARNQTLAALGSPDPEHAPISAVKGSKTVQQQLADIQTLLSGVVAGMVAKK